MSDIGSNGKNDTPHEAAFVPKPQEFIARRDYQQDEVRDRPHYAGRSFDAAFDDAMAELGKMIGRSAQWSQAYEDSYRACVSGWRDQGHPRPRGAYVHFAGPLRVRIYDDPGPVVEVQTLVSHVEVVS